MKKLALIASALTVAVAPALAGPTCSPSDERARILASASPANIHSDWKAPNHVGYG